jgi:hypothetical protein
VVVELRDGGDAMRQIHAIIQPRSDLSRLVVLEVYTPGNDCSSSARCDCYCLNMLVGSAQSLAATDGPDYTLVNDT